MFNAVLAACGGFVMCLGLYRMCPVKLDAKFFLTIGPLATMVMVMTLIFLISRKQGAVDRSLTASVVAASSLLPTVTFLCLAMGFGSVFAQAYQATLSRLIESGGPLGAIAMAFFMPSSTAASKIVEKLWERPELRINLMTFLATVPLVSYSIFVIRQLGLTNVSIVKEMYQISIMAAFVMIPLVRLYAFFFGL